MFIDDCINCTIVTGPCDGSIFIRTCTNCTVYVVAKQIRFRDNKNLTVYTYCPSDPALETSNVTFAPFNYKLPNLNKMFVSANFTPSKYTFIYSQIIINTNLFTIFLSKRVLMKFISVFNQRKSSI